MKTIYLAGPLFTISERRFNQELANLITFSLPHRSFEIILPQNFKGNPNRIFQRCKQAAETSDITIANCDGSDVDSGTAIEIAIARMSGKLVIGYRTDIRPGETASGVNIMIAGMCDYYVQVSPKKQIRDLANAIVSCIC